jgi:hypothetical protein
MRTPRKNSVNRHPITEFSVKDGATNQGPYINISEFELEFRTTWRVFVEYPAAKTNRTSKRRKIDI